MRTKIPTIWRTFARNPRLESGSDANLGEQQFGVPVQDVVLFASNCKARMKPVSFTLLLLALVWFTFTGCRNADAPHAVATASGNVVPAHAPEFNPPVQLAKDETTMPLAPQEARFQEMVAWAKGADLQKLTFGEILQKTGQQFLGKPYVAGLLDREVTQEPLVVNLDEFDCLLLVETTLALGTQLALQDYDYAHFQETLRNIRYRNGQQSYGSRLHYFTDWIREHNRHGRVQDVTQSVGAGAGAVKSPAVLNFMSTHRSSYPQMATNDVLYQEIVQMEKSLVGNRFYYIPKANLKAVYAKLQPGDILATATGIAGLDVTHTGYVAITAGGGRGFLNASSVQKKVIVSPDLYDYTAGIRAQIGILVIRPIDPRTK